MASILFLMVILLSLFILKCRHYGRLALHGDASAKSALYKDRFLLLFQRISRLPEFSRPAFDSGFSEYGTCEVPGLFSSCQNIYKLIFEKLLFFCVIFFF